MKKLSNDLRQLLSDVLGAGEDDLHQDTTLEDAGIDSLATVELSVLLAERLDVALEERAIAESGTLGGLDELIARRLLSGRQS